MRTTFTEPPIARSSSANHDHDKKKKTNRQPFVSNALTILRWLALDTPYLMLLLLFSASQVAIYFHDEYILPQFDLLEWSTERAKTEVTYYKRLCTAADQSTFDPEDLIIADDDTSDEMVDKMLTHGISVLPNLLSMETATALRETIVEHNTVEENFGVISNKHRYSYGIRMEQDEIVRKAVKEISTNPKLVKLLPKLIGDDPALYKFHGITSAAGAVDQHFHWDVKASASAVGYTRTFAPIYSLFIPLQHTPASMGPTDICPGSHVCSAGTNFCEQTAFQILLDSIPNTTEPVWPATYGALMNQQTTHRGRAHYLTDGPDRVLFILAITPRPRTEHVSLLETRSLSLGGSYAIHWTQWGHTWSDLYKNTMYNPIKTLKSLGLYKSRGTHWGREWLMTALLQLANGDYWGRNYLESHIANNGFWFFPKFLHAALPTYDSNGEEDEEDYIWYDFFHDTFRNVVSFGMKCLIGAFAFYTIAYTWVQLIVAVNKRQGFAPVMGNFRAYWVRMFVLHGIAIGVGVTVCRHIDSRPWSKHIRSKKMYTLPKEFRGPDLPSTLPVPQDILMLDDFQSDYLASYTRLFEVGHPGNRRWKRMIESYGMYPQMPVDVQNALQESLVKRVETVGMGRFLTKNSINQWARMTQTAAKAFVHKELMRVASKSLDVLLREIAFRRSETKFGTWRDTALHKLHIPDLLNRLEERIGATPQPTVGSPIKQDIRFEEQVQLKRTPLRSPEGIIENNDSMAPRVAPSVVWDTEPANEPFPGAWLQVGDRVDALYSESEAYWYPGTIVEAFAHSNKWVIEYDNYVGTKEVCRYCVLPWKPLEVEDYVEVSHNKKFFAGHLYAVHENTVDFVFDHTPNQVHADIPLQKYRRPLPNFGNPEEIKYMLGQPVFALWYNSKGVNDGNYYAATVVAIEYPNTDYYTILYADQDEVGGMHARDLLPMTYLL